MKRKSDNDNNNKKHNTVPRSENQRVSALLGRSGDRKNSWNMGRSGSRKNSRNILKTTQQTPARAPRTPKRSPRESENSVTAIFGSETLIKKKNITKIKNVIPIQNNSQETRVLSTYCMYHIHLEQSPVSERQFVLFVWEFPNGNLGIYENVSSHVCFVFNFYWNSLIRPSK